MRITTRVQRGGEGRRRGSKVAKKGADDGAEEARRGEEEEERMGRGEQMRERYEKRWGG